MNSRMQGARRRPGRGRWARTSGRASTRSWSSRQPGIGGGQRPPGPGPRRGVVGENGHLVGQRGVHDDGGPVLEGGDVGFSPRRTLCHMGQGVGQVGAPEVIVPHRPAGDAHPGALEAQRFPVHECWSGPRYTGWWPPGGGRRCRRSGRGYPRRWRSRFSPAARGVPRLVVAHLAGELDTWG